MKKIVTFILALFYLSVSTGASVHLSYCMGKMVNEGLWHSGSKKCSTCGMEKKENGCCKDEFKQLKIDSDQTLPEPGLKTPETISFAFSVIDAPSFTGLPAITILISRAKAPPETGKTATYIRNRVFRI